MIPQNVVLMDVQTENSMRGTFAGNALSHVIDVKTRSMGVILNKAYKTLSNVQVKLISTDLPDKVLYNLSGSLLQKVTQDKMDYLSLSSEQNAFIPFSLTGNLDLNDDSYIQITITVAVATVITYDTVVSAHVGSSPFFVKESSGVEFDSQFYNQVVFPAGALPDVRYNHLGKSVRIPQLVTAQMYAVYGVSVLGLIPNTTYTFSEESTFYLLEY
ncbi:hypothetical protein [Epilithonimonas mollis]|uniref:Uncharacterized protein n=1 Tax=Epilithonimonas mollis TaxID=216903 RepID=A0A1M6U2I4_9FLAO|nr:hypothetical protein [Epilithonimonas mollis]SHK63396.1 hypothetical protein SAMN05444371_3083 [Epilithonimonas mollis]